ncbi:zf-HC2 domain-containing protein [Actinomadura graeca]|uniref:Zf-HC2 domain-containing protein n=1 Tax=Actinomadura graeca TaxID=2750812 RepID=A0ABX8R0F0_9ACTN|nr:zf-HC2 domain-containing protein [Actinomadura graeca]QXJ24556.1 zf-HC2 domain-containing protein [Actinomadura graeca]
MSCLGESLTALVDGELGHEERDRALAHLAGCAECRAEADALRRLKGRLRELSGPSGPSGPSAPAVTTGSGGAVADDLPTDDFVARLRSLAGSAGAPPTTPPGPSGPPGPPESSQSAPARPPRSSPRAARPSGAGRPRDNRPAGRTAAAVLRDHSRRRYLVVGAATLFIGFGTASYAAGGRDEPAAVTPAFDRFAVEHALTSGDAPMTDPLTDPVNQVQTSPGP